MDFFIESAFAQGAPAGQQSPFGFLLTMALLFGVFYFLLIRPQQKKQKAHRQMVADLKSGDEVLTAGGLLGTITSIGEQFAVIRLAKDVEVKIQRHTIAAVLPKGTVDAA